MQLFWIFADCFWLLDAILQYAVTTRLPTVFKDDQVRIDNDVLILPQRMEGSQLYRYGCTLLSLSISLDTLSIFLVFIFKFF